MHSAAIFLRFLFTSLSWKLVHLPTANCVCAILGWHFSILKETTIVQDSLTRVFKIMWHFTGNRFPFLLLFHLWQQYIMRQLCITIFCSITRKWLYSNVMGPYIDTLFCITHLENCLLVMRCGRFLLKVILVLQRWEEVYHICFCIQCKEFSKQWYNQVKHSSHFRWRVLVQI